MFRSQERGNYPALEESQLEIEQLKSTTQDIQRDVRKMRTVVDDMQMSINEKDAEII